MTYIIILRNAAIIMASITAFAGFFVMVSTWLVRNSHEPHVEGRLD